jgi:hypothetical protein
MWWRRRWYVTHAHGECQGRKRMTRRLARGLRRDGWYVLEVDRREGRP